MAGFNLGSSLRQIFRRANGGLEIAVGVDYLQNLAALQAFDQHLDIAVGKLQALHNVDDGTDLVDLVGLGSSMEASCWVARKIFLSLASASSSARTLDSRPTTKGVIMYGKMTTSRIGIMGSFLVSNFSRAESLMNHLVMQSELTALGKKKHNVAAQGLTYADGSKTATLSQEYHAGEEADQRARKSTMTGAHVHNLRKPATG
jgi:hypothetical protein